jgi:hypothetical protein
VTFYFDEDSAQHRLIAALRSHSIDVVSSLDCGMNARDDESQLSLASAQGRVLVSANVRDFAALHKAWLARGCEHSGILLIPQQRYSTGEIVRRMVRLASSGFRLRGGMHDRSSPERNPLRGSYDKGIIRRRRTLPDHLSPIRYVSRKESI